MLKDTGIKAISQWRLGQDSPFVVAGPCSAETREQVLETARLMQGTPVNVFRAGLWKPRTRPGAFEGVGVKGLAWLAEVREKYGLAVTTEVATPNHVEACLKHDIDMLWVGARTTVNPFAVQEIADALDGVDIPLLVKNPINPDLDLWVGALERFLRAGITRIGVIHRGFASRHKDRYRFTPNWGIPIELRRRIPEIPIICDPSHICGCRDWIQLISQTALDLTFEGLMIETHVNPDTALSDAKQQLTPAQLARILDELNTKQVASDNPELKQKLFELRLRLDSLDVDILNLLVSRMEVSRQVGALKSEHNMSVFQPERWRETLENRIQVGQEKGLSGNFVRQVYEAIHEESILNQKKELIDHE